MRYGPKSKYYQFLRERDRDEEMLPMMSVYITGLDFDPIRLTNKYQNIMINNDGEKGTYAKNAIPYNIGFTLNLWTLHMVDIDQIYEQILPYFIPHAFIRVSIPEIGMAFDVKVILNSCSSIMTEDVGEEDNRVIKWDTVFTAQTWLFKPVETTGVITTLPGFGGTSGTSGYEWTSGKGTSGFGSDGTSGKIVNRYYMNKDNFVNRDEPIEEIYNDTRASETISFKPIGIDAEENKVIIDYEKFGADD